MENVFQEVRSDKIKVDSSMIDLLFECLDAIEGYLNNIKASSDEGTEDNELIIKELNDFIARANGEAPAAEEAKPEEPKGGEAASGETAQEAKYAKIELSDHEQKDIAAAREAGSKIYGLTVFIQKECLLKAARAFLVFRAIEEFGQILVYRPSSQDIEDEKFDLDFSIYVATNESVDKLIAAAKNVSEIEQVLGGEIVEEKPAEQEEAGKKQEVAEAKKESTPAPAPQAAAAKAPAGAAPAKKAPAGKPATNRTVRVDIEKLDALMNQVSELIIAKNSLAAISAQEGSASNQSLHDQIEYLERITTNLHESVMKVRMVPIESVVNKFPRMIRDLSRSLNKKMELVMTGEDTELDRTVVDQIGDPLQHLLRNSADHGLEDAALRAERGKPEVGTIFLNAYQEGNNVIIQVGDDGNGIDTEAVKNKALERGIITPEQAETMSQKEIVNLLFMPSFSMAKKITDISGRGVGLDVVKSNIEQLGGDVETKTKLGEGTTFTVRLPLTLAIIQALMVEIRDEKYAIALGSISNIEDIPVKDIKYVQAQEVIHLRGMVIPLIRMDKVLDIPPREDPESLTVVIVKRGDSQAGLVVDNLMGQQEIVIKSLGKYINGNKLISGATILGDGEVALILDVNTLM
jgi:two-component system chemotaxis sensor kinase CheA